jgi:NADPH:quinone reductase
MRAIAAPTYGPLDRLVQIDAPVPTPGRGEVRVLVVASALNPADYKVVLGTMKFLHARNRPLVVGYDFSGVVDVVGPQVSGVSRGDEVFGCLAYGPGNHGGAFAEALVAKVDEIALKPRSLSHELAASATTTGLAALQSLRDLGRLPVKDGQVLAIGVARKLNARVTALGSGPGLELARRLGAAEVWDRTSRALPGDVRGRFDVVFDAAAAYRWRQWRAALKDGGAFVSTLPSLAWATDKVASLFTRTRVHFLNVKSRAADLRLLATWLEEGLQVPLVKTVPVREVATALAQLQKTGGRYSVRVADGF